MIDKKVQYETTYKPPLDPDKEAERLEKKQMLQDIESMTARVILMSLPSSNAHRDAMRIRKRYNFGDVPR